MADIKQVGVVGAGLMGSGIVEVCARAGLDVLVREINESAVTAGRGRIEKSLGRGVERGKLSGGERDDALARIRFTTELRDFADREFVIEAVAEKEAIKNEVFAELDRVVSPDAVLATNTSSLPITRIAATTQRKERVLGVHFFNPAPVMKLVEIIPALSTDSDVVRRVEGFVGDVLGKQVVRAGDNAGFVVNALLVPYLLSAIRMYEAGFASAEDIDNGMVLGCSHPMGPIRLTDMVGLDTTLEVAESLYAEFRQAHYAPPPLLRRMVEAGRLGRKSELGGFYQDYRPR